MRLASIATTIAWHPNRSAHAVISSGVRIAAVLIAILSAPASSSRSASATVRTPPPTVSGANTWFAVRRTTSSIVERPSGDAEMSR